MFDLEKAIAAWRRSLEYNRAYLADDLDELEQHIRDQIAGLVADGLSEEEAFRRTMAEMGDYGAVEGEYRKVYWGKIGRSGEFVKELLWRASMLKNYFKVAWRNAIRHRSYAALNVFGLALGMACSLLILLYVQDEISFDRIHRDAGSMYRVNWDFDWNNSQGVGPGTPPPLAAAFAAELPGITAATRLYPVSRMVVRNGDVFFSERRIVAADTNFFDLFDFPLVAGDPRTALTEPNSVILTETTARRYFGDTPALGRFLAIGAEKSFGQRTYHPVFRVTGVLADLPHNSHLQFDLLTSMASHPEVAHFDWSWVWMQVTTYVKLGTGVSAPAVEAGIPGVVRRRAADAFKRIGFSYDDLVKSGGRFTFVLQPFNDVYLGSADSGNRLGPVGNRTYVLTAATVAVFVLLIACINFMNLATARSVVRAREVGVRKVLGSQRGMLVGQFLAESLMFSGMAVPLALVLVGAALGPFNQLSGKALELDLFHPAWLPAALLLLPFFVGLVAGSYPGVYLSSFRPVQVLKGTFRPGGGNRRLRHVLVVFQFAMTIGLIACTLLVRQQLDFMRRADLGFDRNGIVVLSNENDRLGNRAEAFKERLTRHPEFVRASLSTGIPPYDGFQDAYMVEGQGDAQVDLISYKTDEDLVQTLGIQIVQGRGFSPDFPADAGSVILNEAAVRAFGLTDPVGKTILYPGGDGEFRVIGVMRDFNFLTLRAPITPFALFHHASDSYQISDSYVVVRLADTDPEAAIRLLESEWKAIAPDMPFEYGFLDDSLEEQYQADGRLGRMFGVFSLLTICIACMGLLGLAAFSAEQRTKEIGIRKVMGASIPGIVGLLSKDFISLVLIAFVVAVPLAYFAMRRWLEDFIYRIEIGPGIFLFTGALVLLIAILTVSYQSIKAALSDPVKSLRYE